MATVCLLTHHNILASHLLPQNDTWARIRRSPDFRREFGVSLFTRMFEFAPAVWGNFPWGRGVKEGESPMQNKEFIPFAMRFVDMFDLAIDMLGPDVDWVEEQLQHLGAKHTSYGLMPKHYTLMGRSLLDTLEEKLGHAFTARHKESWHTIYTFMSVSMMQGAFADLKDTVHQHETTINEMKRFDGRKGASVDV
ncbi:Involved in oxygen transport in the brain. Hexacoordinate globin [Seminavis robusta]|uniref:Involved in oxygen transport in the brain. Hexacoordinate globin n=1 Tax=Seminavis robusta TaxID=568900 RepID=A0A9N8EM56_9STRA|nr:Involved in oxygen transport in the brain. Hexacoordinate globin [Seminavis robusta]|eukprot:Sro1320_g262350.1 Involved in oxygen transport in the brain. Hexacoordinate globin (194) ;mRNA; f:1913-2594